MEQTWKDHVPEDERSGLMLEYDDGSAVFLASWAGGGAPGGAWSTLQLMKVGADGQVSFRRFQAVGRWVDEGEIEVTSAGN